MNNASIVVATQIALRARGRGTARLCRARPLVEQQPQHDDNGRYSRARRRRCPVRPWQPAAASPSRSKPYITRIEPGRMTLGVHRVVRQVPDVEPKEAVQAEPVERRQVVPDLVRGRDVPGQHRRIRRSALAPPPTRRRPAKRRQAAAARPDGAATTEPQRTSTIASTRRGQAEVDARRQQAGERCRRTEVEPVVEPGDVAQRGNHEDHRQPPCAGPADRPAGCHALDSTSRRRPRRLAAPAVRTP